MLNCIMLTRILFSYFYIHYEVPIFALNGKKSNDIRHWCTQRVVKQQHWVCAKGKLENVQMLFQMLSIPVFPSHFQRDAQPARRVVTGRVLLCVALLGCRLIFSADFLLKMQFYTADGPTYIQTFIKGY